MSQSHFETDPWPLLRWLTTDGQLTATFSRPSVDGEFVRLGIDSVSTRSPLRLDVYVRLSAAKYVRVARQSAAFDPIRTDGYRVRGVQSLFLRRADLPQDARIDAEEAAEAHGPITFLSLCSLDFVCPTVSHVANVPPHDKAC